MGWKDKRRWNTVIVGFWTGVSRVLGLAREVLGARMFGMSLAQSAFVLAFRIPNLLRRLFGEGALSAAFVPVFATTLAQESKEAAQRLGRQVLTLLFVGLATLVVAGIGVTFVIGWLMPDSEKLAMALPLLRIMFPYAVFICMTALCMGMLTALGDFRTSSFSPAILNIVWIAVLLCLCPFIDGEQRRIVAVSWGVVVAGVLQFALQWHRLRRLGCSLAPCWRDWRNSKVIAIWKAAIPAVIGAGVIQINVCLDSALAMLANTWAPAALSYAEHLVYLPLGLIATAMGTVLLPSFSRQFAENDTDGMRRTLAEALKDIALIAIPAAVGLIVLAKPITALVYERGVFTPEGTLRTSRALCAYSLGLVVFSVQKVVTPLFYAMRDTKTPVRLSIHSVIANAALNIAFIILLPSEWKHVGIAVSTVLCALGLCLALFVLAQRRIGRLPWRALILVTAKAALASALMGAAAHAAFRALSPRLPLALALALAIALALLLYAALHRLLRHR
ncbi:MAG: murein biosynthesis integral membrane protein MurJ [Kiritimatiellaeota bacterium]|nr:murein biosynthesis integral membrane protein MurJ [Kiritimatiellota bacterium]